LSGQDIRLVFAACVFPIHAWSIFTVINEVPAWILRLDVFDLLGMLAYTQAFALIESLLVTAALLLVGFVLPRQLLSDRMVSQGSLLILVGTVWTIAIHAFDSVIRQWGAVQFLPWLVAGLVSLVLPYFLTKHLPKLNGLMRSLVQRLSVLSFVYAVLGAAGLVVILLRNLG
jgi:hypothetical protein